jgi:hypothetical protein
MIRDTRRYARAVKRNTMQLAASLRQLQDAGAHLTYGRKSFAQWAATEFADLDLTADAVKKLCKSGRALLVLAQHERIDLTDHRTLPGTTGARALSAVLSSHGEQAALAVFDSCPPDHVSATTVSAAAGALLPPKPAAAAPPTPLHEDEDEEPEDEPPEEVQRLQASIERIRDLLDELYLAEEIDPVAVQRAYDHLLEDTQALGSVLDAVLPVEVEQ